MRFSFYFLLLFFYLLMVFSFSASFLISSCPILNLGKLSRISVNRLDIVFHVFAIRVTNGDANRYLHMKSSEKSGRREGNCEKSLEAIKNSTTEQIRNYEILKGRRRTLDQKLRAVVTLKRNYELKEVTNYWNRRELSDNDRDLYEMMESVEEDEAISEDDEEYLYERYITELIQENKLKESEINLGALSAQSNEKFPQNCILINRTESSSDPVVQVHKPSKSGSWGLFERPADISKTYGGGRRITREEMRLMDEKYQLQSVEKATWRRYGLKKSQSVENDNEKKIKDALNRSRSCMLYGDRNRALKALEEILHSDIVGFRSELGGEVYLEYGMALETVDRGEESRNIYAQLVAINCSSRIKKSAMQLLQGLEITLKLRKKCFANSTPAVDMEAMQKMSSILSIGLRDEWSRYKEDTSKLWIYGKTEEELYKLETMYDSYTLLQRCISSTLFLDRVPSPIIRRAVRKMFLLSEVEKIELMKERVPSLFHPVNDSTKNTRIEINEEKSPISPTKFISLRNYSMEDESSMFPDSAICKFDFGVGTSSKSAVMSSANVFEKQLNGSYELLFSFHDKPAGKIKRVEPGSIRRYIFFSSSSVSVSSNRAVEAFPSMWGLSVSNVVASIEWNPMRNEIYFMFDDGRGRRISPSPWQDRSQSQHTLQVVWIDKEMMITNEINKMISEPDLFTVWRRMKPTKWRKY